MISDCAWLAAWVSCNFSQASETLKDELNQYATSPQPFNLANYHCFTFSQMSMVHGLALPQTSSMVLAPRS